MGLFGLHKTVIVIRPLKQLKIAFQRESMQGESHGELLVFQFRTH